MSSGPCVRQRFANVAALWWSMCGPTISPRKKNQPPAGDTPRRTAGLWRIGAETALELPPQAHAALLEPAVQDQRRCHPDRDINRHQADQADECRKGGYRPE